MSDDTRAFRNYKYMVDAAPYQPGYEGAAVGNQSAEDVENIEWVPTGKSEVVWSQISGIPYKYNERKLLEEVQSYVDATYGEHYAQGKIQTTEFIIDMGDGIPFTRGNVIKYAQRYGKKGGRNRKDLLKILHYALIMLHVHDLETKHEDK